MTINEIERGVLHRDKVILAPMVRCGTLPLRLTCLDYGADLVYSPEIVDKRIIGADRVVNTELGTVDYIKKGALVIRIHPREKPHLIFQMGTADPDLALQAALTVIEDVAGVDVNCGCPKKFSIQGGMGAALLTNPDKLIAILTNLVKNVPKPVSCKIRVFDNEEDTMTLVDKIVATGVTALAIHCRTRDERPAQPAHWDRIQKIVKKHQSTLPIIVNGDVFHPDDIEKAKTITGCCSVMIARGALINPSIFLKTKVEDMDEVVKKYIIHAIHNNFIYQNIKYTLLQMYPDPKCEAYLKLQKAKSSREICESFEMDYDLVIQSRPKLSDDNNQVSETKQVQNEECNNTIDTEGLKRPVSTDEIEGNTENPTKQLKLDN